MSASYKHAATYQGYTVQSLKFRRSAGLFPETSWIELRIQDLQEILVKGKAVHWRGSRDFEVAGLMGIHAWFKKIGSQTTDNRPQIPALPDPDKGLNICGDLVLNSVDPKGSPLKPVTYKDLFVDQDGIEEVLDDLADPTKHDKGTVRVPLCDIRAYYAEYGAIYARVNCKLRTGEPDVSTMQSLLVPWSLTQVFSYLFSQLPGNPQIDVDCDLFKAGLKPPADLIWEGDKPASCIQQLLDQYGLQASILPDNNYTVWRKYKTTLKAGEVYSDVGQAVEHTPLIYEKKTVTVNRRPAVVTIFGRPRCRRMTLSYVPVFRDIDGRIYQLKNIGSVWQGYSFAKLNSGFLVGGEKGFKDVTPLPGSGANGRLHKARREILRRDAYKLYAPEAAFNVTVGKNGVASLTDQDLARFPWCPMMAAPVYLRELDAVNANRIAPVPVQETDITKGDLGPFTLVPPIVHGQRVDQDFYPNFSGIQRYFNSLIGSIADDIRNNNTQIQWMTQQVAKFKSDYLSAQLALVKTYSGDIVTDPAKELEKLAAVVKLEKDGVIDSDEAAAIADPLRKIRTNDVQKQIDSVNEWNDKLTLKKAEWQAKFDAYKEDWTTYGGVPAWTNIPLSVLPDGYSLDEQTGVVMFTNPMFHMDYPFCIDQETEITVVDDGRVSVTFGYELKGNAPSQWTSVTFAVDPADDSNDPTVYLTGVCRATAIKPLTDRAPNMRLYETDLGTPMNLTAVVKEAEPIARAHLAKPLTIDGYEYRYVGFREAVLDQGTSSIQIIYDGSAARTYVFVNSPNAMGPMGPAERPWVRTVDAKTVKDNFNINREVEG